MPGPPQRVDDFSIKCDADTALIADARKGFTAWLRRWVPNDEAIDDLTLVLSELMANAVRAASSEGTSGEGATVHVIACQDGDEVVLAVRNPRVRWVGADTRWDLDDPLRPGGRGLLIVETLVDELEIEHDERDGSTTVRSRRSVAAQS